MSNDLTASASLAVSIMRLAGADDLPLPDYQTSGSAGMDLHAAIDGIATIASGARLAVPTGVAIALPPNYEAQVRGRSGLARKYGISMANGVGTIDSDYRGQIQVLLINQGSDPFELHRGDRIAQLVVARVERVTWIESDTLDETVRGEGGFGHTGSKRPV